MDGASKRDAKAAAACITFEVLLLLLLLLRVQLAATTAAPTGTIASDFKEKMRSLMALFETDSH